MITTKNVNSSIIKEKKPKNSNRSNTTVRTKNRKIDLKKEDLLALLARFEGELQGKEIALAALKSQHIRILLSNHRFSLFTSNVDPHATLLRDSERLKDDLQQEFQLVRKCENDRVRRLTELVAQQRDEIETLRRFIDEGQRKYVTLHQELENERKTRFHLQILQRNLWTSEKEKIQLKSELEKVQCENKELQQQLTETMKLLESQHERHKHFLVLFLNQRKLENDEHQTKIEQLTNASQEKEKFHHEQIEQMRKENERNENVLTKRIRQLEEEIDALIREKAKDRPMTTIRPKSADLPSTHLNESLSPRRSLTTKISDETFLRSKNNEHVVPTVPTRLRQTVSNADSPSNPVPPTTRRYVTPVRPISNSNLRKSNRTATEHKSPSPEEPKSDVDSTFFQSAESGDAVQLVKMLKLGVNPNRSNADGNTCLHLSTLNGHLECVRNLFKFGANPNVENQFGKTPWNNLSRLKESSQLEFLREFVEQSQVTPPIELIFGTIEREQMETFDYLLNFLRTSIRNDTSILSRLTRVTLRSSNTHFLTSLLNLLDGQNLNEFIDSNTFVSTECSTILTNLDKQTKTNKSFRLLLRISSRHGEHPFSYAIGQISLSCETSWLELERSCVKLFTEHIAQLDSPLDYVKSSVACTANSIDTLALGQTKWHYQDSPTDDTTKPFTIAQEQHSIIIELKGLQLNAVDSIAYNYFTPSQHLKNFIRYIEQNPFVGVYGAPYMQKRSLFDDLIRYLERPMAFSSIPKFRSIKSEIEIVTSLEDLIDELVEQEFLRSSPFTTTNPTKILLYFSNVQNSIGQEILQLLLSGESVNEHCSKLNYNSNANDTFYFPSKFHIFITLSKRAWPTEISIYKEFKWIPFKIENDPWSGLLKRHLWRRMIDTNICKNRAIDNELVTTLKWVTNVWQRYNECLPKLSLQDALLGPALFFDCPMERDAIFEWLQNKWNSIVAPLVRELSVNKCVSTKTKSNSNALNSLESNNSYETVACTALYVLLHRAISRDCPLTGPERDQYLLNFIGSRLEPGSNGNSVLSSMNSSAASSRTTTPQPASFGDFASIQLE